MKHVHRWLGPALAAGLVALAGTAQAHTSGAHDAGLAHGFAHPFGGLDHLLAMVTVGLWAMQRGGRALWLMPATFVGAMALGGYLGLEGVGLPMVELGIAASLMAFGSVVAFAFRPPLALGVAIVGAFAVLHGHAHGAEVPEAASPLLYAAGFLAATALLHAVGIALAGMATRHPLWAGLGARAVRLAGAGVAATGLLLVA
ncbi:MAG TPA: HupE/UreJ family protein [Azospirillum sp.]|nr:HupE/UreJ family protein [Azospirillum sp.]